MRTLSDPELFRRDPVGAQLVTQQFAVCCPERAVVGFSLWGTPDAMQIDRLAGIFDAVLQLAARRHVSLVDMGLLAALDPIAFQRLTDNLTARAEALAGLTSRQALIKALGFAGALVSGVYAQVAPSYPVKIFADLAPTIEWLGIGGDAPLTGALTAMREAAQLDPLLLQLRTMLRQTPRCLDLSGAARQLGLSQCTLQRRLMAVSTTFQGEAQRATLEHAQSLMLAGRLSLTRIALELGFTSLQHFSASFRKHHGHSPSAWLRDRARSLAAQ